MRTHGLFQHPLFQRHLFRTPAVRHLAWLVYSRPLLNIGAGKEAALRWPAGMDAALIELDRYPQPLLAHLAQRVSRRLGLYFEQLYGFALVAFLGQRILAQNLPLRMNGRTLGELDFLVHDPISDQIVHHEIAVKFYMGWTGPMGRQGKQGKPPGWYGPDTRDHLDAKLKRLREHQLPMWQSELGRRCLRDQGLAEPQASVLGLYGYLFEHQDGGIPALPAGISAPESGMTWCRASEHPSYHSRHSSQPVPDSFQAVVRKPDWLGPLQYPADYQPAATGFADVMSEASHRAVLLATLRRTEQGFWLETGRQFLTPAHWCFDPEED